MIGVYGKGGRGPMDSIASFTIQYVSGMADRRSCEEETFTCLQIKESGK